MLIYVVIIWLQQIERFIKLLLLLLLKKMICEYCEYKWETRKDKPKSCPRCKRRFDYPISKQDNKDLNKEKGKEQDDI